MTRISARRSALFGMALVAMGCDLATFAVDPKPIFEETWNLPVTKSSIWVKDLLPSGGVVTIPADSSSFSLKIDSTAISAVLSPNCVPCQPLNGTSAPKPAFTMSLSNSTALPLDIVSATVIAGQITIKLTNNLTFDPLFVNTGGGAPPQGFLAILVHSGSVVFGVDTVFGAAVTSLPRFAQFPPGTQLNRTINLLTGIVTTNLTVDVTVSSPLGDHPVPINTTRTFDAVASVPFVNVSSVRMNVPARTMNSGTGDSLPKMDNKNLVKATLEMTIVNPFPTIIGNLTVKFAYGPGPTQNITKTITLPAGTGVRTVTLDSLELQTVLQSKSVLTVTGSVSSPTAITVTPKQVLSIDNRLIATVRTPGGK